MLILILLLISENKRMHIRNPNARIRKQSTVVRSFSSIQCSSTGSYLVSRLPSPDITAYMINLQRMSFQIPPLRAPSGYSLRAPRMLIGRKLERARRYIMRDVPGSNHMDTAFLLFLFRTAQMENSLCVLARLDLWWTRDQLPSFLSR